MLIKTKINKEQKYVKINEPNLKEFLNAACIKFCIAPVTEGVRVFDETGTEVDSDVFEEIVQLPNLGVLTITFETEDDISLGSPCPSQESTSFPRPNINEASSSTSSQDDSLILEILSCTSEDTIILGTVHTPVSKQQKEEAEAKRVVESALTTKPGGDRIINEYNRTKSLTDSSRRQMIQILAADMTETYGTAPPRRVKVQYARGIVELFPYLRDPLSKNGYNHFYDVESGTGYLAWRLKNIQRNASRDSSRDAMSPHQLGGGGPTARRDAATASEKLTEEQCKEAVSFMKYSADENSVKLKMKLTFEYRRNMVLDEARSFDVLTEFPRFKDFKGLIDQDFVMEFGEDVAARFLERWATTFKEKVIEQCKALPPASELEELLYCATAPSHDKQDDATVSAGWDSDLASVLLLLHLIPPSAQGRKRPGKMSAAQAERCLVVFVKTGTSVQEHVDAISGTTQPYLLAVGMKKSFIHEFFIVLDKQAIPCRSASSLAAFDELFKAHFVFGTRYNRSLHAMYTFILIQTTVYNIDVGKVHESPRVAEVRARFLQ